MQISNKSESRLNRTKYNQIWQKCKGRREDAWMRWIEEKNIEH